MLEANPNFKGRFNVIAGSLQILGFFPLEQKLPYKNGLLSFFLLKKKQETNPETVFVDFYVLASTTVL